MARCAQDSELVNTLDVGNGQRQRFAGNFLKQFHWHTALFFSEGDVELALLLFKRLIHTVALVAKRSSFLGEA